MVESISTGQRLIKAFPLQRFLFNTDITAHLLGFCTCGFWSDTTMEFKLHEYKLFTYDYIRIVDYSYLDRAGIQSSLLDGWKDVNQIFVISSQFSEIKFFKG